MGDHAYEIPINASKSMIGHLMGAAGAVETIATIKTLNEGIVHPTTNQDTPDPDCDLDCVPNVAREVKVHIALKNSFGFGGQNACLVLGRYE
jgi:3-oxoacyl-[acyl-carrier-protein] synthase II